MLLRLPSGTTIAYPPYFLRRPPKAHLTISSEKAFHPDHVTSRLCLQLLDEALDSAAYRSALDIGCGSGILALLAAYKGVPLVAGLDIDRRAIVVSRRNALANDLSEKIHWLEGTIAAVRRRFECVVANLPYLIIHEILEDMAEMLEEEGVMILSGFHDIQWWDLVENLSAHGFILEKMASGDQSFYGVPPSGSFTWMAVQVRKTRQRRVKP